MQLNPGLPSLVRIIEDANDYPGSNVSTVILCSHLLLEKGACQPCINSYRHMSYFKKERCVDSRIGDKILCTRLHFYLTGKSGMVCKCTLTLSYKSLQIGQSLSYYATKLLGGGYRGVWHPNEQEKRTFLLGISLASVYFLRSSGNFQFMYQHIMKSLENEQN